jgi:hypothetical protein
MAWDTDLRYPDVLWDRWELLSFSASLDWTSANRPMSKPLAAHAPDITIDAGHIVTSSVVSSKVVIGLVRGLHET